MQQNNYYVSGSLTALRSFYSSSRERMDCIWHTLATALDCVPVHQHLPSGLLAGGPFVSSLFLLREIVLMYRNVQACCWTQTENYNYMTRHRLRQVCCRAVQYMDSTRPRSRSIHETYKEIWKFLVENLEIIIIIYLIFSHRYTAEISSFCFQDFLSQVIISFPFVDCTNNPS